MRGSVFTRVSTRAAATGVVPAPTTGAVVLQHPFVDGIFYKGTGVQQVRVSVVVRLQAAARGFLARRRLQKAHKQMRDREAALAVVAFAFDAEGCDLDSLDGQLCRSADVSKGEHGVFPVDGVLQLRGMVVGEVCSSLSPAGTHCLAPQLSVSDHREDVSVRPTFFLFYNSF
jgi:hypothetical protein